MSIEQIIEQDREFIRSNSVQTFLRANILGGVSRVLDSSQHEAVRDKIANHFNLHVNKIIVVGSAKLGYSVNPRKFFEPFNDKSDVDVAIVCPRLFEQYWLEMYRAKRALLEWNELPEARKYLFRGWIRPDKLPLMQIRNDWFDFFASIQSIEGCCPYPIRAGLYFNEQFLELYQEVGVQKAFEGVA